MTDRSSAPHGDTTPWDAPLRSSVTADEIDAFRRHGYLHLPGFFGAALRHVIRHWVLDMETWPETPGRWMMYFESGQGGQRMLCRIENFLEDHAGFSRLLCHPSLLGILGQLMGEQAVLFKEKINFKLPGGKGFAPHQDAPAFVSFEQRYHITAMIGVDEAVPNNGCLEVVSDLGLRQLLPQAEDGTLSPEVVEQLAWKPLPTKPGDLLLFDSYLPHRSGDNRSSRPRRALYVTYNRLSEGDRRGDYYRDKREKFPPECEREAGRDYSAGSAIYNLANPIRQ